MFISGNALIGSMLFVVIKVYFLILRVVMKSFILIETAFIKIKIIIIKSFS